MGTRLSPAATLLRNSKLFAIPAPISLPPVPPSSDQVSSSDTATTVYPRYAAIETTDVSGNQGDWGFKRPLPLKTTRITNNPVVRLVNGIDTPENIADFESAADHVLTLRKFQELHTPIEHASKEEKGGIHKDFSTAHRSVFRSTHDNILPQSRSLDRQSKKHDPNAIFKQLPARLQQLQLQADEKSKAAGSDIVETADTIALDSAVKSRTPKAHMRWRYAGPSLSGMSGMEFDDYVHKLGPKEQAMLVDKIKSAIIDRKKQKALDKGETREGVTATEEEIREYTRYLRNHPSQFGQILTDMLDLPAGPVPHSVSTGEPWEYGRSTLATDKWTMSGPPRTHPSAGLSYLRSDAFAHNDPREGPQKLPTPVIARALKMRTKTNGTTDTDWGVAGFMVPKPGGESLLRNEPFEPKPGGTKTLLRPFEAVVDASGKLVFKTNRAGADWIIQDDEAISTRELNRLKAEENNRQAEKAPRLSGHAETYKPETRRRIAPKREPILGEQEYAALDEILSMKPRSTV